MNACPGLTIDDVVLLTAVVMIGRSAPTAIRSSLLLLVADLMPSC